MVARIDSIPVEDLPAQSPHYVRAVTGMGDSREVVASQDIYASNGMKLLAKGARIDSLQFERLTRHRLTEPLDDMLIVYRPVDPDFLALEADRVIEHDPVYRNIMMRGGDPRRLKHSLSNLHIPPPVMFRLTVMSEQSVETFAHSVRTAMIAFAIGQRLRMTDADCSAALLASLCHDFGEMHTNPAILDPSHHITPDERRFLHVHPLTAYVLLHEMPGFAPSAAKAILQHHERLDGSGYPRALQAAQITTLGRLTGVADVAEAVIRRFDMRRVEMLFRINQARFDPAMVTALRELLQIHPGTIAGSPDENAAVCQLNHLGSLLNAWFALRALLEVPQAGRQDQASPVDFLFDRMANIRSLVLQAGLCPDNMSSMLEIVHDAPEVLMELRTMLDEMDWLLADLANEIDRRSPELTGLSQGALKDLRSQLDPVDVS